MSTEEVMTTGDDDRWCQVNEEDDWMIVNNKGDDEDDKRVWSLQRDGFNQEGDRKVINAMKEEKDRK